MKWKKERTKTKKCIRNCTQKQHTHTPRMSHWISSHLVMFAYQSINSGLDRVTEKFISPLFRIGFPFPEMLASNSLTWRNFWLFPVVARLHQTYSSCRSFLLKGKTSSLWSFSFTSYLKKVAEGKDKGLYFRVDVYFHHQSCLIS